MKRAVAIAIVLLLGALGIRHGYRLEVLGLLLGAVACWRLFAHRSPFAMGSRAPYGLAESVSRALLECGDYAVFATERDGHLLAFNATAERLTGHKAEDLLGKPVPMRFLDTSELDACAKLSVEQDPALYFEHLMESQIAGKSAVHLL